MGKLIILDVTVKYIHANGIKDSELEKINTEGFEFKVLNGVGYYVSP